MLKAGAIPATAFHNKNRKVVIKLKQYYQTRKAKGDTIQVDYWVTQDPEQARAIFISLNLDFILPLGNKRPRNIPKEFFQEI